MTSPRPRSPATAIEVSVAPLDELGPRTLYGILQLRSRVFVVEQECIFLDSDGRDLDPGVLQLWVEQSGEVVACARLLPLAGGDELGRIVVASEARGRGLGEALVRKALDVGRPPLYLKAQTRLRDWYERLGFEACGAEFLDDGVPHLPMRVR
jgi:ElaA protein